MWTLNDITVNCGNEGSEAVQEVVKKIDFSPPDWERHTQIKGIVHTVALVQAAV